ncbi:aminotransferase class I/II-fold pyridoxal phosphate-dependent enzyme [Prauserella flavalba]|uniref:Aminotransferase class I/classII large domain-containing protein n=1 Tax=Prauserella flavalba TaxID=1477506 RepID=A0A318LGJ5_9PSEU|nr:aminotransferase class I/II-fold pyridoxal phosphate-dependent enzyme [Prauserella flavalba]PXY26488.1 hypothetical protein BA062_23975 [Prauserella flavalba]
MVDSKLAADSQRVMADPGDELLDEHLAPEFVAVLGSASKTLAPGLRLGWLVTPPSWTEHVAVARRAIDLGISTLDQLVLTELFESSALARHLRQMRKTYSSRRATMLDAVKQALPSAQVPGVAAGLHMQVMLPPEIDEERLVSDAALEGLKIYGLHRYQQTASAPPGVVLGFARATDAAIVEGVQILARLVDAQA